MFAFEFAAPCSTCEEVTPHLRRRPWRFAFCIRRTSCLRCEHKRNAADGGQRRRPYHCTEITIL